MRTDEMRRNLRELLTEVERDGVHVTIARYNIPAAVMVPVDWYEQAKALISKEGQS